VRGNVWILVNLPEARRIFNAKTEDFYAITVCERFPIAVSRFLAVEFAENAEAAHSYVENIQGASGLGIFSGKQRGFPFGGNFEVHD
jgi:hypothetical protein